MSTNETLFTILSLIFFSMLNVTFYNSSNNTYDTASDNQAIINGVSFGQSLIEDITLRSFDENTINNNLSDVDSLTNTMNFGPDPGEYYVSQFDDIDDFNNYTKIDSIDGIGTFSLSVGVNYISETNLSQNSYSKTFLKKITVYVENEFLKNSIILDYIVGY